MKTIREAITFDDVLLVPKHSKVFSRKDVNTKTQLSKNISLNIPIVSANMDTVTEANMAITIAKAGGIGIIHRFLTIERQVEEVRKVKKTENVIIENPITINPDSTLKDARAIIKKEDISSLLVMEDEKLVGIITSRDILFETDDNKKIKDVMTKEVITAPEGISFEEVKKILHKHRIEKLPILNNKKELVGLITLRDIMEKISNPNSAKDKKGRLLVGAAVGVKEDTLERTTKLLEAGADVIVIDIAHGHNTRAIDTLKLLKKHFGKNNIEIIAGNIATGEAALDLIKAGADGLKVGIGPGSACNTRAVTGVGVPQLTAIMDVVEIADKYKIPVIADGGIKNSGSFSKALAAGASTIMSGGLFAGCKESPGEYMIDRGMAYKYYRGMASYDATSNKTIIDGGTDGFIRAPEGASGRIPYKGEASIVITDLISGLRSSMSYLGANDLKTFAKNAEFIRITNAGATESGPRTIE